LHYKILYAFLPELCPVDPAQMVQNFYLSLMTEAEAASEMLCILTKYKTVEMCNIHVISLTDMCHRKPMV
jgi:hypothetical protein